MKQHEWGYTSYENTVFKHLFFNKDASLYMFKNSTLKCYKSLYEVCKMGECGRSSNKMLTLDAQKWECKSVTVLLHTDGQ